MTTRSIRNKLAVSAIVVAGLLFSAAHSSAQTGGSNYPAQQQSTDKPGAPAAPPAAPAPPKGDPAEESDYKAFFDLKPEDNDKRIELGEAFVQKYPNSKYTEGVYSQLASAEYNKQQYNKMYADADKALAVNPDDVSVLVLVGWVIPHSYNPNDVDGDAKLDKAEKYEKHALASLETLQKPSNMTDDQFAKAKVSAESQAHSGLGLVYFRRGNYEGAVAELTKGTATAT